MDIGLLMVVEVIIKLVMYPIIIACGIKYLVKP